MTTLASGTFRLKGSQLLEKYGSRRDIENPHQLSLASRISWPTVSRLFFDPETERAAQPPKSLDYEVLWGVLVDGLGITPKELERMPFGELFELLQKNGAE